MAPAARMETSSFDDGSGLEGIKVAANKRENETGNKKKFHPPKIINYNHTLQYSRPGLGAPRQPAQRHSA